MIQSSPEELLQILGLQAVEIAQLRAEVARLQAEARQRPAEDARSIDTPPRVVA